MKMLVSLLLALLTVKVSSVVDKRREDPSTRQEYLQVRDAGLSAAVCQQHIHAHSRDAQDSHFCQHLHSALAALRALNFASIAVYDCSTLHHHAAHLPSNRTAPLICTDVSYSSSSTDGRMDQADVFVMIGNSLVPSLPSSAPAAHQQHAAATLASLGAKSRVCLYLHTGASAHLLSLSLPGHAPSAREQRAAVRNLGAYDQVRVSVCGCVRVSLCVAVCACLCVCGCMCGCVIRGLSLCVSCMPASVSYLCAFTHVPTSPPLFPPP